MPRRTNVRAQYIPEEETNIANQTILPTQEETSTDPTTSQDTAIPLSSTAPQNSTLPQNNEKPQDEALEKVSFYITAGQLNRLYDLVNEYRKRTGIRKVNRNDIIRLILDQTNLDHILPQK